MAVGWPLGKRCNAASWQCGARARHHTCARHRSPLTSQPRLTASPALGSLVVVAVAVTALAVALALVCGGRAGRGGEIRTAQQSDGVAGGGVGWQGVGLGGRTPHRCSRGPCSQLLVSCSGWARRGGVGSAPQWCAGRGAGELPAAQPAAHASPRASAAGREPRPLGKGGRSTTPVHLVAHPFWSFLGCPANCFVTAAALDCRFDSVQQCAVRAGAPGHLLTSCCAGTATSPPSFPYHLLPVPSPS